MTILTKWVAYNGEIGVTVSGDYYNLKTERKMIKEYHNGQIKYRSVGSNRRYSWKKLNETKKEKVIEVKELPF